MPKKINLLGRSFGRLSIISESDQRTVDGKVKWNCVCTCGNTLTTSGRYLRDGDTRSCGCLEKETLLNRNTSHGLSGTSEYNIWKALKQRCYNPNELHYADYGGRGILICDRWLNSFENFIEDMGNKPSPTHSIDRIDNDGNYEPSNCKWSTKAEQGRNKRNNRWIEHNGVTKHLQGWADHLSIQVSTLHSALKRNSFSDIFNRYADSKETA